MGFLKRDDGESEPPRQAEVHQAAVDEAPHAATYEAGSLAGIPDSGLERIARMKQEVARGFFTSDLSVNEFLLVKQSGFEPLGLVLGSSIYHIGFQQAMWNQSQEMGVLTQAMYHARELAMTRMEEEADALGADGVVGVRLDIGRYDWGADLAEFIAVGTAVKHSGGELHRAPNGRPFTSDMTGQDFATLLRAGYRPAGLVMGNCVYHVARQGMLQSLRQIGRKVERHYGRPQDIEWAVEHDSNQILLLQSRPETVWSAKEAAPVARGSENPLSHVMTIFGGRK